MGLEVLYLLIPASVLLAGVALILFIWAIHTGQFDDLETPALRVLFEDGTSAEPHPPGTEPANSPQAASTVLPHPENPAPGRSLHQEEG